MSFDLKYSLIEHKGLLGYGAFSQVYEGVNTVTKQRVAVKVINMEDLSSEDLKNVTQEIRIHSKMQNKNIVQFYDFLTQDNKIYLVQELAENGSLFNFIPLEGLEENIAMKFFLQIIEAVYYMHQQRIIHRDIKPENIFLDENFQIKIGDFGWATGCSVWDRKSSICGTLEYMSPEIVENQGHDEKTDMWCLGVLFYEMVFGRPPFQERSRVVLEQRILQGKLKFIKQISKFGKTILENLVMYNTEERWSIVQLRDFVRQKMRRRKLSEAEKQKLVTDYINNNRFNDKQNVPKSVQQFLFLRDNSLSSLDLSSESDQPTGREFMKSHQVRRPLQYANMISSQHGKKVTRQQTDLKRENSIRKDSKLLLTRVNNDLKKKKKTLKVQILGTVNKMNFKKRNSKLQEIRSRQLTHKKEFVSDFIAIPHQRTMRDLTTLESLEVDDGNQKECNFFQKELKKRKILDMIQQSFKKSKFNDERDFFSQPFHQIIFQLKKSSFFSINYPCV